MEQNKDKEAGEDMQNKFTLDTAIEDEGGNLSVGQVGSLSSSCIAFTYFFLAESCFLG